MTAGHDQDLVLALSGGVGGAKLVLGLSKVVPAGRLVVVANTGDDFEHLGLHVSPDIDTLLYALAGFDNPETGWGRRDETWTFMAALDALGGETWFRLGDGDLATHVERTRRLKMGEPLSNIVADFSRRFRIEARICPMTDDAVRTRVRPPPAGLSFSDISSNSNAGRRGSRFFLRGRRFGASASRFRRGDDRSRPEGCGKSAPLIHLSASIPS